MADQTGDVIAMWQQMVGEMQKGFRAFSTQLPAEPASHDAPDQTAGPGGSQKQLIDLMESYFAGLNLPSRAQLNGMADRLQTIEAELTDIKALLHEALMNSKSANADHATLRPAPARPKRPASGKSQPQRGPASSAKDQKPS